MDTMISDDEMFGRRIRSHDRYQFEMKLDYKFDENSHRQSYLVEAYFFFPDNIGLRPNNYKADTFYEDVQNYIRFKTPIMSLEQILSEENDRSPLVRIRKVVEEIQTSFHDDKENRFIRESQMLACIFKSTLREKVHLIYQKWGHFKKIPDTSLLREELVGTLKEMGDRCREVTGQYRKLGKSLLTAGISKRLRSTHQLIDEYMSLTIETYCFLLLEEVEKLTRESDRKALFNEIRQIILEQEEYRRQKGYLSVIDRGDRHNELYLYRQGMIKKFSSRILFLDLNEKNISNKWIHITFAVAAGIAMAFATALAFYAQNYLPNYSLSLLMAFVVVYMFKDRMKDFFREVFKGFIERNFYDRNFVIIDPNEQTKVGVCKEKFYPISLDKVPTKVLDLRSLDTLPALRVEERGEHIFHYQRSIDLFTRKVYDLHHRIPGLNDIIRFNIHRFLYRLDEPYHTLPFVREGSGEVDDIEVAKVYHINAVFVFSTRGDNPTQHHQRLRVVLNQRGIIRVEEIPPS